MPRSQPELRFEMLWRMLDGPALETEYRFHPSRRWRADFAHLESKTLIEIEGGVWSRGRHTRGAGYTQDAEKYNEAAFLGWRVLRLTPEMIVPDTLCRIIALCTTTSSVPLPG